MKVAGAPGGICQPKSITSTLVRMQSIDEHDDVNTPAFPRPCLIAVNRLRTNNTCTPNGLREKVLRFSNDVHYRYVENIKDPVSWSQFVMTDGWWERPYQSDPDDGVTALREGIYTSGDEVDPSKVPDFSSFSQPPPRSTSELRKTVTDNDDWRTMAAVAAYTRAKILQLDVFHYINDRAYACNNGDVSNSR